MPCKATSSKPTLCRRAGLPPVNGNCSVLDLCRFSAYLAHFSPLQIVLLGGNLLSLLTWIWVLHESSTCHFLVAHCAVYVVLSMLQYLCCTHTNSLSVYLLFFVLFFFLLFVLEGGRGVQLKGSRFFSSLLSALLFNLILSSSYYYCYLFT